MSAPAASQIGRLTAGILQSTVHLSNTIRVSPGRPVQPRSLTRAEQRAQSTRPDLWPAFLEPTPPLDAPEAPALDDGWDEDDDLDDDLR